jgi:hypothetical protein
VLRHDRKLAALYRRAAHKANYPVRASRAQSVKHIFMPLVKGVILADYTYCFHFFTSLRVFYIKTIEKIYFWVYNKMYFKKIAEENFYETSRCKRRLKLAEISAF